MMKRTSLLCLIIAAQIVDVALAQIAFREDFKDANINDGSPVRWVTRTRDDGEYDVSTGDLVMKASDLYDTSYSLAADPIDFVMGDTSVISQVRGVQPFDNMGIGARWNEAETTGYYAGLAVSGTLFVGKCDGTACPLLGTTQLDGLNIADEDVLLRFDAIGETLNVWGWRPGESMPQTPQLTVNDSDYDAGTAAVFANPLSNGEAIYRFINVSESPLVPPVGRFGNARRVQDEINLGGSVEGSPAISRDGLELFFKSNHDDPNDIFRVTRNATSEPFGNLESANSLNTQFEDNGANLSSDELTIYFSSDRDSGFGDFDLYQATRKSRDDPFENVRNLGEAINTEFLEISPNVSPNGLELFFASDRPGGEGGSDIWVAHRESVDGNFGEPVNLGPNINSPFLDATPTLSPDGLHLIYTFEEVSNAELQIASRPSLESDFGPWIQLDEFGLGSSLHSTSTAEADPFLSADWPAPGSKIYYTRYTSGTEADLWEATWSINGDTDFDGLLTVADINDIMRRIGRRGDLQDVNQDGEVTQEDIRMWVEDLKQTYFGDANLDGEFNSSDLTVVFQAGQYEDDIDGNSTWETGDWNGDREFNTSDLVVAFQSNGYEKGPRAVAIAVPEPNCLLVLFYMCVGTLLRSRSHLR